MGGGAGGRAVELFNGSFRLRTGELTGCYEGLESMIGPKQVMKKTTFVHGGVGWSVGCSFKDVRHNRNVEFSISIRKL